MDGTDIFFRPLRGALPAWIDARCLQYPVSGGNDYLDLLPLVREACRSFSGSLALMIAAEAPTGTARRRPVCVLHLCAVAGDPFAAPRSDGVGREPVSVRIRTSRSARRLHLGPIST